MAKTRSSVANESRYQLVVNADVFDKIIERVSQRHRAKTGADIQMSRKDIQAFLCADYLELTADDSAAA